MVNLVGDFKGYYLTLVLERKLLDGFFLLYIRCHSDGAGAWINLSTQNCDADIDLIRVY